MYAGMTAELIGMVPKSSGMYASYEIVRRELSKREDFGDTCTYPTTFKLYFYQMT